MNLYPGGPIPGKKGGYKTPPEPRICTTCWNILRLENGQPVCPKGHRQP